MNQIAVQLQQEQIMEIELRCQCPQSCPCERNVIEWKHRNCQRQTFITSDGDLTCHQPQCHSTFIQHARFYCNEYSQGYSHRSASNFLMSLAQALQAANYKLEDQELYQFSDKINKNVQIRWNN